MGQTASEQQNDFGELIRHYTVESKCQQGTLLNHKVSKETFLLKEVSFMDQDQYKQALDKYRNKKDGPLKENLLSVVEVEGRVNANFCSGTYKLYIIYEYPTITLQEEILARAKQTRFFDEQDLWSIMQSCLNGVSELGEAVLLDPQRVFIMNDGLVKIVDPDVISDGTRFVMSKGVYYAPERFQNFNRTDRGNSSEKQTMFSLGMSLLHSAILDECFDCYCYDTQKFSSKRLEERVGRLAGLYSDEFIFVMSNLLEMNSNRRSSILELQDVINRFWSKETQQSEEQEYQSDSQKADVQLRQPMVTTVKINTERPTATTEAVVNFNKLVKLKDSQFQMSNKVTFSEICDVDRQQVSREPAITPKLANIKEVNSGFESEISSRVEDYKPKYETRKPLQSMDNYIMQEPNIINNTSQKNYKDSKYTSPTANITPIMSSYMQPTVPRTIPSYISAIPTYVPTYSSLLNPISPSFYYPLPPRTSSITSNENLFTDPKLLQLLRKDLSQINTRRTLSRQNTYQSQLYHANYSSNMLSPIQAFEQSNIRNIESTVGRVSMISHNNSHQIYPPIQTISSYPKVEIVKEMYEDGRVYEGSVLNGIKEGEGKLIYPDGAYYEGHFSENKMHGFGTLYYRVGKPAYEGYWHEDQFHGKGILYNENPVEQLQPFDYSDFNLVEDYWIRYEGDFEYDNKHGPGRLLLANGEYFEGQFEKDCIHGPGRFYDKFGNTHSGMWDNNVLEEPDYEQPQQK